MGESREKEEDRPPAGVSLCLVLHLIMIVLSWFWLSSMQEIEFDDMAKRDWVAGECLVVGVTMRQIGKGEIMSTWAAEPTAEPTAEPAAASEMRRMLESRQLKSSSSRSSSSSSSRNSDDKWRVIVHVERSAILGDSDAGDDVAALAPGKALPDPHTARYQGQRRGIKHNVWWTHNQEHEAKAYYKKYKKKCAIAATTRCAWDPRHPKRIALRNDGGDWTWVRVGIAFFALLGLELCTCVCCLGCATHFEHADDKWEEKHAHLKARHLKEGARVEAKAYAAREFFPGKIEAVNSDGTFEVVYDHGGKASFVKAENIKLIAAAPVAAGSDGQDLEMPPPRPTPSLLKQATLGTVNSGRTTLRNSKNFLQKLRGKRKFKGAARGIIAARAASRVSPTAP